MRTLIRGTVPGMRIVSGGSCLFLILVSLAALAVQSVGQSTRSGAVSPIPGGSNSPQPDRKQADGSRPIELYRTHCIDCHETDGRGESSRETMPRIPDFTKPEWHRTHDDDRLQHSIRNGKGLMPAMKNKVAPTEVVHLVALVRNFRDGKQVVPEEPEDQEGSSTPPGPQRLADPTRPVPRSGEIPSLFQRLCSKCHGADGHGNAMRAEVPSLPDFTSSDWHQLRNDAQMTTSILEGKGTVMPAFSGKLDEPQVRELVGYLRSFAPAGARSTATQPSSDFHRRFHELQDEMNKLKQQYRALSRN
jgi:mono/diheme cytochrome c family protein